jgi:hypothetical protein
MTPRRPNAAAPQRDDRTGTWWFVVDAGAVDGHMRRIAIEQSNGKGQ